MPLDLESLRCFEAAAVHLNFREAARGIGLSPAAFGDRIRRLEEELQANLFVRTTRRVELTDAGHRLLPQARRALVEAQRCADAVHADDGGPPYTLAVGTRFELGMSWLVPSLTDLEKEQPRRRLDLYFGDSEDLLHRVRQRQLDCLISSVRLSRGGLTYSLLHEEKYVLVARASVVKRHPLQRPSDASAHTLLDIHDDLPLFRYFLDARKEKEVWAFERVQYLGTIAAVRHRVMESAGVAVLPEYFVTGDLDKKRLVRLLPKVRLRTDWFRLVWRKDHPRDAEIRALADSLQRIPLR